MLDTCLSLTMNRMAEVSFWMGEQHADNEAIRDCYYDTFTNTKTNFYMSNDLNLPWWFGLLCFSYSFAGLVLILQQPTWAKFTVFPYYYFAYGLLIFQGPLCFMADYVNMTRDSIFHAIDRNCAVFLVGMEFWHIFTRALRTRTEIMVLIGATLTFALFSFMKSQESQRIRDAEGFTFWHSVWHTYPILCHCMFQLGKLTFGESRIKSQ